MKPPLELNVDDMKSWHITVISCALSQLNALIVCSWVTFDLNTGGLVLHLMVLYRKSLNGNQLSSWVFIVHRDCKIIQYNYRCATGQGH